MNHVGLAMKRDSLAKVACICALCCMIFGLAYGFFARPVGQLLFITRRGIQFFSDPYGGDLREHREATRRNYEAMKKSDALWEETKRKRRGTMKDSSSQL